MSTMNQNERLMKFLQATPEQQELIDRILEGKAEAAKPERRGPLLVSMGPAAQFLGVSRSTLWRMIQAGRLDRVEVFTNSFRVRREDLEAIAAGKGAK